jgi:hypothetical protein
MYRGEWDAAGIGMPNILQVIEGPVLGQISPSHFFKMFRKAKNDFWTL